MGKAFKIIFGAVIVLGVASIGLAFLGMHDVNRYAALSPQERKAEEAQYAAKQALVARQRMIDNKDGQLCIDGSGENASTVERLKETLREPDSFAHISTLIGPVNSDGTHNLVMRYRAKNGFGGMSFGTTRAVISNLDCSATIIATA